MPLLPYHAMRDFGLKYDKEFERIFLAMLPLKVHADDGLSRFLARNVAVCCKSSPG